MSSRRPQRLDDDEPGGLGGPPTGAQLRDWKRRDREDKIREGWNVEANNFWRVFWRGMGTRFRKKRTMKEKAKKGRDGDGEEADGGAAADAEPAAEGALAV
ncbi:MAG: hypothetical protein L6R42_002726 [Xanthoria sp. 1 TBL-2021]|nr:MAG: hypothetical protein L6R42_002726 [Xanthoria sp. 1 TBL-2021]